MRNFIKIVESGQTVYHGSRGPLSPYLPFFVTPDFAVARAYADDRGGHVYSFSFHPTRVASTDDIRAAADKVGLDHDNDPTYALVSPNVDPEATKVIAMLRDQGFDCAEFWDYAPDNEFKEVPAIVVFDHDALSSPTLMESVIS